MRRHGRLLGVVQGVALCGIVSVAASAGIVSLSLVDQVVVLGIAVVVPLAVGGRELAWAASAAAVVASFLFDPGWAGLGVLPFAVVAVANLVRVWKAAGSPEDWSLADLATVVAGAYAVVAAAALALSRFGLDPLDVGEPIGELTAVHYMYAGTAALVLAREAAREAPGRWQKVGTAAIVLTAAAPPVVAVGFVTEAALPQVGGAVLMALGVYATATLELRSGVANVRRSPGPSALLAVSGLAVWIPMVLAVAWASGQHWDIPALSIPDMARTHGLANALGFVLCGLVGRRLGHDSGRPARGALPLRHG